MIHKIGDIIKETNAFGDVKVVDIYKSTTKDLYMYQVEVTENLMVVFASDEDLEPYHYEPPLD